MKDHNARVKASEKYRKNNSILTKVGENSFLDMTFSNDEFGKDKKIENTFDNMNDEIKTNINISQTAHQCYTNAQSPTNKESIIISNEMTSFNDQTPKEILKLDLNISPLLVKEDPSDCNNKESLPIQLPDIVNTSKQWMDDKTKNGAQSFKFQNKMESPILKSQRFNNNKIDESAYTDNNTGNKLNQTVTNNAATTECNENYELRMSRSKFNSRSGSKDVYDAIKKYSKVIFSLIKNLI